MILVAMITSIFSIYTDTIAVLLRKLPITLFPVMTNIKIFVVSSTYHFRSTLVIYFMPTNQVDLVWTDNFRASES